jgi:hypothetical protein
MSHNPSLKVWLWILTTLCSDIRTRADQQWGSLPRSFRITGSLKDCNEGPWERDFLASTRLNYLHLHFLLRLLCLGSTTDPDAEFISLSREILSLVVEVIILRQELVCSTGTSFEWKVSLCDIWIYGHSASFQRLISRNQLTLK